MNIPTFSCRGVLLRALREADLPYFVEWRNDPKSLMYWLSNRAIIDEPAAVEEFWQQLRGDKHVLLVATRQNGEVIGTIYSYNAQFVDQNCFVTAYIDGEYRNRGYGAVMMAMFIDYLFSYFSFRKIYLDIYEHNTSSTSAVESYGLKLEGHFPEHRYFDGEWHAMNRYALYRTEIERVRQFLARASR